LLVRTILGGASTLLSKPSRIQVSGRPANLNGLCQRVADLSDVSLDRAKEPEATARGLARLVTKRPSFRPGESDRFEPVEDAPLRARFARFRSELERAIAEPSLGRAWP